MSTFLEESGPSLEAFNTENDVSPRSHLHCMSLSGLVLWMEVKESGKEETEGKGKEGGKRYLLKSRK